MAESTKAIKAKKKKAGAHRYTKGRAFIPSYGATEPTAPSMLVRSPVNELVRIEIEDWQRAPDLSQGEEIFKATAIFRDGRTITREAVMTYKHGERERIISEVMREEEPSSWALRRADNIRKRRWSMKQQVLGGLQKDYSR